jgi:hypothetical protein
MCIVSLVNNEIHITIADVEWIDFDKSVCDIKRNLLGQSVIICDSFLREVALKYNIETRNLFPFWGKLFELTEIDPDNTLYRKYKFTLEKKPI